MDADAAGQFTGHKSYTTHHSEQITTVPKFIRALEVPNTLQVGVHKLALHGHNFYRRGQGAADLRLAPPESPKGKTRRPIFSLRTETMNYLRFLIVDAERDAVLNEIQRQRLPGLILQAGTETIAQVPR